MTQLETRAAEVELALRIRWDVSNAGTVRLGYLDGRLVVVIRRRPPLAQVRYTLQLRDSRMDWTGPERRLGQAGTFQSAKAATIKLLVQEDWV